MDEKQFGKANLDITQNGWAISCMISREIDEVVAKLEKIHPHIKYMFAGDDLLIDTSIWPDDKELWEKFIIDYANDESTTPDKYLKRKNPS